MKTRPGKVTIEPLKESEISTILDWNENRSADYLFQWAGKGYAFPLTGDQILDKITSTDEIGGARCIVFKITDAITGKMIGTVELSEIDRKNRSAWVSRFLIGDEKNRNRGYGSKALSEVIRFAYETLGVENLFLRVFDFNKGAVKCYENMGFKKIELIEKVRVTEKGPWNAYVMVRRMQERNIIC